MAHIVLANSFRVLPLPSAQLDVLFVVPVPNSLSAADAALLTLMEGAGFEVTQIADTTAEPAESTYDVVFISETTSTTNIGTKYATTAKGVVNARHGAWSAHGYYADTVAGLTGITTMWIISGHSVAAGYAGTETFFTSSREVRATQSSGVPAGAFEVAQTAEGTKHAVVFGYEAGATMDDAGIAEGRRVAMGFRDDTYQVLSAVAQDIFIAALNWAGNVAAAPAEANVLFVRGFAALNTSENQIISRLEGQGHTVTVTTDADVTTVMADGYALAIVSKTVGSATVSTKLNATTAPVLFWEDNLQAGSVDGPGGVVYLATIDDSGQLDTAWHGTGANVYVNSDAPSAIRAGLSGSIAMFSQSVDITFAPKTGGVTDLVAGAIKVAEFGSSGGGAQWPIYAIDQGVTLADGTSAPGKRGYFGLNDDTFRYLTTNGLALFDAMIDWLTTP